MQSQIQERINGKIQLGKLLEHSKIRIKNLFCDSNRIDSNTHNWQNIYELVKSIPKEEERQKEDQLKSTLGCLTSYILRNTLKKEDNSGFSKRIRFNLDPSYSQRSKSALGDND